MIDGTPAKRAWISTGTDPTGWIEIGAGNGIADGNEADNGISDDRTGATDGAKLAKLSQGEGIMGWIGIDWLPSEGKVCEYASW